MGKARNFINIFLNGLVTVVKYDRIRTGFFESRPNRFIAQVKLDGRIETCHVKNTGRCRELLIPGASVYLQEADKPERKTRFDLVAVRHQDGRIVNIDSQIPNKIVGEWLEKGQLFSKAAQIYPERRFGNSRFDFYVEDGKRKAFLEVKGVTLDEGGTARFPDAPTERGVRHMRELVSCLEAGYEAYLIFVVQMKGIREVQANWVRHREFGEVLAEIADRGVQVLAFDCQVTSEEIVLDQQLPVNFDNYEE